MEQVLARRLDEVLAELCPEDRHAVVAFAQFCEIGIELKSMVRQMLNFPR